MSHGKAVARMLDAVAGKFSVEDISGDFEHQVMVSMCMIVVCCAVDGRASQTNDASLDT